MGKKKTTIPSTNNTGTLAVAHWTLEETSSFLEYIRKTMGLLVFLNVHLFTQKEEPSRNSEN
jgi:hypothetical protein